MRVVTRGILAVHPGESPPPGRTAPEDSGRRTSATVRGLATAGLALAVVAGCGAGAPLEEWTLAAEEIATLGAEPVSGHTAFYRPRGLAVDGAGNVHVLDSGNHRVQVFDANGGWLRTLGNYGQGPGDLSGPEGLWVFPDGEVLVADTGNQRLQRFGPGGDPIGSTRLDYLPLDVVGTPQRLFVLRLPPPGNVFGPDTLPLVQELDRDGRPTAGHVEPVAADPGIVYFLTNTLRLAATPAGGFALADTHLHSRFRVYSPAGYLDQEVATLYKADALAPLGRIPEVLSDESLDRIAKTAMDLTWDPVRGVWWVLAGYIDRLQDGTWVIGHEAYRYDTRGEYRGSVMLPYHAIALAASNDGTLWTLDADGIVHHLRVADPEMVIP